jgi:hypothetical protein
MKLYTIKSDSNVTVVEDLTGKKLYELEVTGSVTLHHPITLTDGSVVYEGKCEVDWVDCEFVVFRLPYIFYMVDRSDIVVSEVV